MQVNIEKLYEMYFMQVYSYVMTLAKNSTLAEEITQTTFFRAMQSAQSRRGESSELTWLCAIARNLLPVLMGAAIGILPIIAGKYFPDGFWKKNKGLLVYVTDTLLLLLLLFSISAYTRSTAFLRYALPIVAVSGSAMWIFFLIIRYWRVHPVVRAGGFTAFLGVFVMFINPVISYIIGAPTPSIVARDQYTNNSIGLGCMIAGIAFMGIGAAYSSFKKNKGKKAIDEDRNN